MTQDEILKTLLYVLMFLILTFVFVVVVALVPYKIGSFVISALAFYTIHRMAISLSKKIYRKIYEKIEDILSR